MVAKNEIKELDGPEWSGSIEIPEKEERERALEASIITVVPGVVD